MDATKPTTRDQVRTHKVNRAFGADHMNEMKNGETQSNERNETQRNMHEHSLTLANDGIIEHTHNVSGLDWTSWKADPRTVGRSSGKNDISGSWHEQSALPTSRNSVDDMSDDAFKDMMKRYAAENFSGDEE